MPGPAPDPSPRRPWRDTRLTRGADYLAVRNHGRSHAARELVLCHLERDTADGPRIGVIASRRVGNAVTRNRAKRRLREITRSHITSLPANAWIVLIARRETATCPFRDLEKSFVRLAKKAGLLHPA